MSDTTGIGELIRNKRQRSPGGWLRTLWRYCTDGSFRAYLHLRTFRPDELLQPNHYTAPNRYPEIFAAVSELKGCEAPLKLLSFGCSTGEEVADLLRAFPGAHVTGTDINRWALKQARRRVRDPRARFVELDQLDNVAPFDAVFCMAVLQRRAACRPELANCSEVFPFEIFARQLARIDRTLQPGGLLVVHLSNFRVTDAPATHHYESMGVTTAIVPDAPATPLFAANGERLPDTGEPIELVYRKPC